MHLNLGRLNGRGGAHPNSDNLAWECSGRELRGRKMKFDSRYWHKRAIEMRSIANETKNPQSKETMLGIAHDYDLLGYQIRISRKMHAAGRNWNRSGESRAIAAYGQALTPLGS